MYVYPITIIIVNYIHTSSRRSGTIESIVSFISFIKIETIFIIILFYFYFYHYYYYYCYIHHIVWIIHLFDCGDIIYRYIIPISEYNN